MADPIQVERNFQELMTLFDSTLSIRHRYKLFKEFAESLEGSFKKYESYIIQLLEELPVYSDPLSWSGLDPIETEEDLLLIESIQSEFDLSEKSLHVSSIKKNLQKVCLLLYACLNEAEKADEFLIILSGRSFLNERAIDFNSVAKIDTVQMLSDYLSDKLQPGSNFSKDEHSSLKDIHQDLVQLLKSEKGNVLIPVAEIYERDKSNRKGYGRLRKMTVELFGKSQSSENDELIWATNIYGAETPSLRDNEDLVSASRKLFDAKTSGRWNWTFYKGGIQFKNRVAIHDGNSANLGISALWFIKLLEANSERERYQINPRAVITGDIDYDGTVEEVDRNTIGLKVQAAFFSWANVLIVPFFQRSLAERELMLLQEKYPQKNLSIIGVNNLQEVFYDRRVASRDVEGRVKYFLNRVKKEYANLILLPSILLFLLIMVRLASGPIDNNPQNFSYEGSSLILENKNGVEVERLEVGTLTASLYTHAGTIAAYPLAILTDLTGDGINEIIYGKLNRLNQSNRDVSEVTAYSVSGDSTIWTHKLMLNYEFPRQSGVTQQEMFIREMALVQADEGAKIIVNANSSHYFQTILYLVDAKTGNVDAEYLHIGHIRDMILEDINGDNKAEVIFTGINNAYWLASLGVLDVKKFEGYSPLTEDYRPNGIGPASELHYVLLPKTIIAEYTNPIMKFNEGNTLYYDVANERIRVTVEEARIPFREEFGEVMVSISFDENLKPVGVGSNNIYDILARQLYEEGEIERIPDFDYFQSYQDSIKYWNGSEFILTKEYFNE